MNTARITSIAALAIIVLIAYPLVHVHALKETCIANLKQKESTLEVFLGAGVREQSVESFMNVLKSSGSFSDVAYVSAQEQEAAFRAKYADNPLVLQGLDQAGGNFDSKIDLIIKEGVVAADAITQVKQLALAQGVTVDRQNFQDRAAIEKYIASVQDSTAMYIGWIPGIPIASARYEALKSCAVPK